MTVKASKWTTIKLLNDYVVYYYILTCIYNNAFEVKDKRKYDRTNRQQTVGHPDGQRNERTIEKNNVRVIQK